MGNKSATPSAAQAPPAVATSTRRRCRLLPPAWKSAVNAAMSSSLDSMGWRSSATSSVGMKCFAHRTMPTPIPPSTTASRMPSACGCPPSQ